MTPSQTYTEARQYLCPEAISSNTELIFVLPLKCQSMDTLSAQEVPCGAGKRHSPIRLGLESSLVEQQS